MKQGFSSTDAYVMILAVGFVFIVAYAIFALHTSYSLEEAYEGIGFRQAAVINTYEQGDSLLLYATQTFKQSMPQAIQEYYAQGTQTRGDECDTIGPYASWNSLSQDCFVHDVYSDNNFLHTLKKSFTQQWSHPVVRVVPQYEFIVSSSNNLLHGQAIAQDRLFFPTIGVKGETANNARIMQSQTSRLTSDVFSKDTRLNAQVQESSYREAREESISQVVIEPSNTRTAERAFVELNNNNMSSHYIISASPDFSITQYVPESLQPICDSCESAIHITITYPAAQQRAEVEDCPASQPIRTEQGCDAEFSLAQLEVLARLTKDVLERQELSLDDIDTSFFNELFEREVFLELVREAEVSSEQTGFFAWPTTSTQTESCYGDRELDGTTNYHDGLDVAVGVGQPVFAMAAGEVIDVCEEWVGECACSVAAGSCPSECNSRCGNFGNTLVIKHSDELFTRYSHLESIMVSEGGVVERGQTIASSGNTGYSFGPHLDIKVYTSEQDVSVADSGQNPFCYFSEQTLSQTRATSSADSCRALGQYQQDNKFNVTWWEDECEQTVINIEEQGCFSEFLDITVSDGVRRDVDATISNLGSQNMDVIRQSATEYDIPPAILKGLIAQESLGRADARSVTGAIGVMQFTAATGSAYGLNVPRACCTNAQADDEECAQEEVYVCFRVDDQGQVDERFIPERAIPAGARFMNDLISRFQGHEYSMFLALQAYNTGERLVREAATACENNPSFMQCVGEYLEPARGLEAWHAKKVLERAIAFGGEVDDVTGDIVCDGVTGKQLGGLEFNPSFSLNTFDGLAGVARLSTWAQEFVEETTDDLHTIPEQEVEVSGWNVSYGFCEDDEPFLNNILVQIQECADNRQSDCACNIDPDREGDFTLVFRESGVLELEMDLATGPVLVDSISTPSLSFVDGEQKSAVRMVFRDGVLGQVEVPSEEDNPGFEEEIIATNGLYKNTSIEGFVSQEHETCLPTSRRHAFCAVNEEYNILDEQGSIVNPEMKFGLYFNDSVIPEQPTNTVLAPLGPLEEPTSFRVSFQEPQINDLSGVLVYCQFPDQDNFTLHSRISAQDITGVHSMVVEECDSQQVEGSDGSTYRVALHSFDFGANENEERDDSSCANVASFSFERDDDWQTAVASMSGWGEVYTAWTETSDLWSSLSSCNPAGNAWMPPEEGVEILS